MISLLSPFRVVKTISTTVRFTIVKVKSIKESVHGRLRRAEK